MKISVELEFFRYFPEDKIRQFMACLKEVEDGELKYGTIELSISPGPEGKPQVSRVCQTKHFEK